MAMTPAPRGGKRPHPAWRARRVTAVVSGVAFVGLATGMAVDASTSSAHAATPAPDLAPNEPSVSTTQPTWAAPIVPQTVPQTVPQIISRRPHTQSHGS